MTIFEPDVSMDIEGEELTWVNDKNTVTAPEVALTWLCLQDISSRCFKLFMDPQRLSELRNSIKDCSDRGLLIASKWYVHPQVEHWIRRLK